MSEASTTTEIGFPIQKKEGLRPEEYEAFDAIVCAILHGVRLTKAGIYNNDTPLFNLKGNLKPESPGEESVAPDKKIALMHEIFLGKEVTFISMRDGWDRLDHWDFDEDTQIVGLPKVVGCEEEDGEKCILIGPNGLGGTSFNNQILGKPSYVRVTGNSEVTWLTGQVLSKNELAKLKLIFEDAEEKLKELEQYKRRY